MFLDFATGKARRIVDLPGAPSAWGGMALSPDRRSLVFTKLDAATSDIMLVEDFR